MKKFIFILIVFFARETYAQWEPLTFGMYGGTVNTLLTVNSDILVGTRGGVFRSTNLGGKWTPTDLQGVEISKFLSAGIQILAATNKGLYVSTNNGVNWKFSEEIPYQLTSFAIGAGYVYAGSVSGGVFRSTDNGTSWTQINTGISNWNITALFVFGQNVFAGSETETYVSSNNGVEWRKMDIGLTPYIPISDMAALNGKIYAATKSGNITASTDNGATWTAKLVSLFNNIVFNSISVRGNELYASSSMGLYYSSDEGENWIFKTESLGPQYFNDIEFNGSDLIAGLRDAGILMSADNGKTWFKANTGLSAVPVKSMAVKGNTIVIAADNLGAFISHDLGSSWEVPEANLKPITSSIIFKDKFFVGSPKRGVFVSSDEGSTWEEKNVGFNEKEVKALASQGDYLMAGADAFYRSSDEGASWERFPKQIWSAHAMSVIAPKDNYIFCVDYIGNINRSTDLGENWEDKSMGKAINDSITSIDFGKYLAFAGSPGGLYISANHGDLWDHRNGDLNNPNINIVKIRGDYVFIGTENGLYRSKDDGLHWEDVSFNLPVKNISTINFDNFYAYVGTKNNGAFRAPLNSVTSAQDKPEPSAKILLYPNPADDFVAMEINNANFFNHEIRIFDMLGAEVLRIEPKSFGKIKINVSELPAGAYILRVGSTASTFVKI